MPQMNKGGKFIFGKSLIRADGSLHLPPQAVSEYDITSEGRVYLFTGSKSTGGFCVTRKGLLLPSQLGFILRDCSDLCEYRAVECQFFPYKGRSYGWASISDEGTIHLSDGVLSFLGLSIGMSLLSIRSSDIAFTMGAKGPLLEKSNRYSGIIEEY